MTEKQIAALRANEFIEDGMIIGLGTGSTVEYLLQDLSIKIKRGLKIKCVSTSNQTTNSAKSKGIHIVPFDSIHTIDLTIDGADEVDPQLNGIKGGGGALLYEKIIASNSKRVIWIVDSTKLVRRLGKFPLPVEVIPFASIKLFSHFERIGYNPAFRKLEDNLFQTDSGNYIIDLRITEIENSLDLEREIKLIPGVVEVGLFNNLADMVIVGRDNSHEILSRL